MKKISCLPLLMVLIISAASAQSRHADEGKTIDLPPTNPFFARSTLPLQAPAFDKIKNSDFKPAMEEGMKQQSAEIGKIANNPAAPTFANTFVAMEKSGQMLKRVGQTFSVLTGAYTNPELQKIEAEEAPKLAANTDGIFLNTKLFKRVETVYKKRNQLKLDPESKRLVEYYYENFTLAGARLSEADKATLRKFNQEEASLRSKFNSQLLAGTRAGALIIDKKSELDGLSDAALAAAAQSAKANGYEGKWVIPLQNTTQQPQLQSLTSRATRERLFAQSWNRNEKNDANDTRATISRIAEIRSDKAKLLGFPNYAAWKLQNQMAKTPTAVEGFLSKIIAATTEKAKKEAADNQQVINDQNGGFQLQAWDWNLCRASTKSKV